MAIQMRRGLKEDFDPSKMLPGEWAVSLDSDTNKQMIWMCFRAGVVKRMGTYEDFKEQIKEATEEIKEEYLTEFGKVIEQIELLAEETRESKDIVVRIRDDTVNIYLPRMLEYVEQSKENAGMASDKAADALESSEQAEDFSKRAESFAHGRVGIRENENVDNAEYYYDQTKRISQGINGISPMGTITFEDLINPDNQKPGYMFNISDSFISDDRFQDGGGIFYGAGSNLIYTADGKWDVLAAAMVSGVKGEAETEYSQGFVNITKEKIGLGISDLVNMVYPVGSIYMSVNAANPGTLFGGTWVAWGTGRVPVGVNTADTNFNAIEKTGGSSSISLTTANLPSHNHGLNRHTHSIPSLSGSAATSGSHTHVLGITSKENAAGKDHYRPISYTAGESTGYASSPAGGHTHNVTTTASATGGNSGSTTSTGSGTAHTNLQPYITCYMWKRIA